MTTILIVDDRSINREVLSLLLDEHHYKVIEAADGLQALELLQTTIPDLIITDIAMPNMDGLTFVKKLRSHPIFVNTPVLFYSATYQATEAERLAAASNVKYVLTKPCNPEIILQTIEKALNSHLPNFPIESKAKQDQKNIFVSKPEPIQQSSEFIKQKERLENVNLRLTNLIEIGLDMSQEHDLDKLNYIMCKGGRHFLNACYAGIIMFNGNKPGQYKNFFIGQHNAINYHIFDAKELSSRIKEIFLSEKPLCIYSPIIDLKEIGLNDIALPITNLLLLPIKTTIGYYGTVYFINKFNDRFFTLSDQRYMMTLTDKFAINYENLILYKKIEHYAMNLENEIKQRKQTEEKLTLYRKKMAEVVRSSSLGEMASSLAHEINQPLAAIAAYVKGCIKHIEKENNITPKIIEILHETAEQAERAGEVVHRIKSFVRKRKLFYEAIDINTLLDEVIHMMQQEAQPYPLQIIFNKNTNLPLIEIDKIQIQQVILNLLRNAMEALQEGNIHNPRVSIEVEQRKANRISLKIVDNGLGFNETVANYLFEPYFTTKSQGMGLGLAICRSVIEAHSGQLIGQSLPGGGSCFQFDLPVQKAS